MDLSPDAVSAYVATRPGSAKIITGVLRRFADWLSDNPDGAVDDWISSLSISPNTASTYRGIVRSYARHEGEEVFAAPEPPPLPEPVPPAVEVPAPRVRLKAGFVAERVLQGHRPPAAVSDDFLGQLATAVAERSGIGAMRAKLDEIAVALDLRPIARPALERGPDVPAEVLRHQITALALALGIGPAAVLLDVAPSGIDRMLRGAGVPRIPDMVEVDNAYVRLRWIQRDLAEDDELDEVRDQMRSVDRDELDARAVGRTLEGGH